MAKLRYIAIQVEDPEASARFFKDALEMKEVNRIGLAGPDASGVIHLSDGTVNLALIRIPDPDFPNFGKEGLNHIGFVVEDLSETLQKLVDAGAIIRRTGDRIKAGEDWDYKFATPDGVDFDVYDVKVQVTAAAQAAGRSLASQGRT